METMDMIQMIEQNAAASSFVGAFGGLAIALLGAGLAEIGRTDDYVIYKYGWYFDRLYKSRGYVKFEF